MAEDAGGFDTARALSCIGRSVSFSEIERVLSADGLLLCSNATDPLLPDVACGGVTSDSRLVQPNLIFIAVCGKYRNGHRYVDEAVRRGASGLVLQLQDDIILDSRLPTAVVSDTQAALIRLRHYYYGDPSENLRLVGVTGTNGKTTTTYMIQKVFESSSIPTAVIGTLGHSFRDILEAPIPGGTTPDDATFDRLCYQFTNAGARAVVCEVTSQALAQGRLLHASFDAVVFTNLSRDHLQFHGTMQKYGAAKKRLFRQYLAGSKKTPVWAIVNIDDPFGARIRPTARAQTISYGTIQAEISFRVIRVDLYGSEVEIVTPDGRSSMTLAVPGIHNVYNACAAISAGMACGIELNAAIEALADFPGVPGRLEPVVNRRNISVFVDYAHTPDALNAVLGSLRQLKPYVKGGRGKLILVLGSGGGADRGARSLMLLNALAVCDVVVVTSDNPRQEDPSRIISDFFVKGLTYRPGQMVIVIDDRREAIRAALAHACAGDVVVVAGKGHETHQTTRDMIQHFSDREVVLEVLDT